MERSPNIFSKIRSKIEGYKKSQQEKNLKEQAIRREQEVENLIIYPDFAHLQSCPKQSGVRTYVLSFGDGNFGVAFYSLRGVCKDCKIEQALY